MTSKKDAFIQASNYLKDNSKTYSTFITIMRQNRYLSIYLDNMNRLIGVTNQKIYSDFNSFKLEEIVEIELYEVNKEVSTRIKKWSFWDEGK